jgi:hypothetical protein
MISLYDANKSLFDKDIRDRLERYFSGVLSAARQRTGDPQSPGELQRWGAELEAKENFFREFVSLTDEQLTRLRNI